jgi:myosin heavy subunit
MAYMKRIALIVVIVACVISLGLVWKVGDIKNKQRTQIAQLTDTLNDTKNTLVKTETNLATTKSDLKQTQDKLTDTETKLTAANVTIDEKTKTVAALETKVAELDKQATDITAKMTEAVGTLQKIKEAFGVEDVTNMDQLRQRVTAQADENKMLGEQIAKLRSDLAVAQEQARTPDGVKGQVAAVNDKWGFMVLNVGGAEKVHKAAQFLLYRDSQLIGKAQVTYVGPTTSIAQMLPEYRRATPRVGDLAIR